LPPPLYIYTVAGLARIKTTDATAAHRTATLPRISRENAVAINCTRNRIDEVGADRVGGIRKNSPLQKKPRASFRIVAVALFHLCEGGQKLLV
jgi:hypothetical protein